MLQITTGLETIPGQIAVAMVAKINKVRASLVLPRAAPEVRAKAGADYRADVAGEWVTNFYQPPDGTIIDVTAGRNKRNSRIQISTRSDGPLMRISVATSQSPRSTIPFAVIEGRFDILYNEINSEGINIETLSEGTAKPVATTKSLTIEGEEVQVTTTRRKRALRI